MITKQAELAAISTIQSAIDMEGLDWVAGETSMSRLTPEEMKRIGVAKVGPPIRGAPVLTRPQHLQDVADPPIFDWRDIDGYNWMTPVKSQGSRCGSCWAFSASGSVEAAFNIYNGNPNLNINVSEQDYISCCSNCGGCNGGWPDYCLVYTENTGVVDENCFEYEATDTNCVLCDDFENHQYNITGYEYINSTTTDFKWALQEYGPMAVVLTVPDDWYYYTAGVYSPTSRAVGWANHAVVLVGWDDPRGAWIIRNSYGEGWGGDGHGYGLVDFGVLEGYNYAYAVTGIVYEEDNDENGENIAPTAIASADQTVGIAPLSVQFTGRGTDPDGTIQSYAWNFGDGTLSNIQNPLHIYNEVGTYTPTLTVFDNDGATGTDSLSILTTTEEEDLGIGGWVSPISVSASSYHSANVPENAIDNNRSTHWYSTYDESNSWVQFDLGNQITIDAVEMIAGISNTSSIQVSNDAVNWTTVGTMSGTNGDVYTVVELSPVSTRYVRLLRTSGNGYFQCTEFNVFTPTGTGWFKPKYVDASSYLTESGISYVPANAIDGFFEGGADCWFSNSEVPCWIRFDLGLQKTIDAVRVVSGTAPLPITLVVEVSNNDATWTPVTTDIVINDSYAAIEVAITQSTARYVRLNIADANGIGGCCEFDVHVVSDTVANIEVVNFTVTPQTCQTPCNTVVSITWENTGNAEATFTPGYTVNDTLYGTSPLTLLPGQQGVLQQTIYGLTTGSYEICPVPN